MPFLATAFGTFLVRQVFLSCRATCATRPRIDGVGHLGFLRDVAVPLVRPTLGALGAVQLPAAWNQYLWPNLITTEDDMNTRPERARGAQPGPPSTSPTW